MNVRTRGAAARGTVLVGLVASLLLAGAAQAQRIDRSSAVVAPIEAPLESPGWETGGIHGGAVTALAISIATPGEVMAAVRCVDGLECVMPVYGSTDLGGSWDAVGAFFYERSSIRRAVATMEDSVMLADTTTVRVRRSGGWFQPSYFPASIGGRSPMDIAVSVQPWGPAMIAFSASDAGPGLLAMATSTNGIYEDRTPAAAVGLDALAVAMDPFLFERRAAAFVNAQGNARVFVTTDGGQNWLLRGSGLPNGRVTSMAYQGNRLLALVPGRGIYALQNGAINWTAMATGRHFRNATRLVVSPQDPQRLWLATPGGLSVSHDGGANWHHQVPGTRGLNVHDVASSPADPDVVMIGVERWGVLSSIDGGLSFVSSTHGIQNLDVRDVAAHPADPRRMAAIVQADGSAWHVDSFDAGDTWQLGGWMPRHVRSLHFDGQGRLHALARADAESSSTFYRLEDGRSWQAVSAPTHGADIRAVHFDVSRPGVIRLAGSDVAGMGGHAMAWTSHDDGLSWEVTWQGPENQVATQVLGFVDGPEDWLLVPTRHRGDAPGVVAISSDDGDTWTQTIMGFPRLDRGIQLCRHEGSRTVFSLGGGLYTLDLDSGHTEWEYSYAFQGDGAAGIVCGDPELEELIVGSRQTLDFWDPILRRVAGSTFETYHADFPLLLPERATRMILTPAGLFLGSEIGLFRNRAPVHADAPHSLQVSQASARMARFVELDFEAGAAWVRVLRNGQEVGVMPNTGQFRERRLADGTTPSYQVCNAFTEGCSEQVTLSP